MQAELGIRTVEDLLLHVPFRYVDKSRFHAIADVRSDAAHVQLKGTLTHAELVGPPRKQRLVAQLEDATGQIELVWFKGAKWIAPKLRVGKEYVVFGKPNFSKASGPFPTLNLNWRPLPA